MSYQDFIIGREIADGRNNFKAAIQAAMRMADTRNRERVVAAFPEIWEELSKRNRTTDGKLDGE